jgi:hypothetical protein
MFLSDFVLGIVFDDLDADVNNTNTRHETHDWKPNRLLSDQFVNGLFRQP